MNANSFVARNTLALAKRIFPTGFFPPHFLEARGFASQEELERRAAIEAQENKFESERRAETSRTERDRMIQQAEEDERRAEADKIRARTLIANIESTSRTVNQLIDRVNESPQRIENAKQQMASALRRVYSPNGGDQYAQQNLGAANAFLAEEPHFVEAANSLVKILKRELAAMEKELAELQ